MQKSSAFGIKHYEKMSKDKRDIYYRLAKDEGWRARSAYKLLQLDAQYDLFSGVTRAVDLCAAPGSWSQVLSRKLPDDAIIISVDLAPMAPLPRVTQIQGDITRKEVADKIIELCRGEMCQLVVCDGAPDVTGVHDLDEYVQAGLVDHAMSLARRILAPGGTFVSKVFRGECLESLLRRNALSFFKHVDVSKPDASRASSMECFLVCTEYVPEGIPYSKDREVYYSQCGDFRMLDSNRSYPANFSLCADSTLIGSSVGTVSERPSTCRSSFALDFLLRESIDK